MAEQLKPKLTEPASEAVDLDNLFAFLSDVQPNGNRNQIIDEIGEKMDELVVDLDVELETVIQQELEGLAKEQCVPTPPKLGLPTLPEPTEPPPPPPPPIVVDVEPIHHHQQQHHQQQEPLDIEEDAVKDRTTNEPIYEAVLPREESSSCVSPPPPPPVVIQTAPKLPQTPPIVQIPPTSNVNSSNLLVSNLTLFFRQI